MPRLVLCPVYFVPLRSVLSSVFLGVIVARTLTSLVVPLRFRHEWDAHIDYLSGCGRYLTTYNFASIIASTDNAP